MSRRILDVIPATELREVVEEVWRGEGARGPSRMWVRGSNPGKDKGQSLEVEG
jgi:hypothetical protein